MGTNKENVLQSLSSLDILNESNSERTRLLENMLQEKVSDGMEEEITPTARLSNPGLSSTFDEVVSGKWEVVYAPHMTTIAGLFG